MKKKAPAARGLGVLLLVLFGALLALGIAPRQCAPRERAAPQAAPTEAPRESTRAAPKKQAQKAAGARAGTSAACTPDAFQRCHQGDVWSEDSCGRVTHKLEECGVQLCREGACEEPDAEPCTDPAEGRCEGSMVRICHAGRAMRIDCAARGMRCVQGDEGAECAPELSREQRCVGSARCEGDVLMRCEAGARVRLDCREQGASCTTLPRASEPSCVKLLPPTLESARCDACGCPASQVPEQCDGRDQDGDGWLDEELDCGPVPLRVVVVADANGNTAYAREDVEAELVQLAQLLESSDDEPNLRFSLLDFVVLREPSWLEMSEEEVQRAADDPRLHPALAEFYVPVLLTDVLFADGNVPRAGASTLPNGFCGGALRGAGPNVGLLALAKARSPTTLLHELGHFFGLCHTHEQSRGVGSAAREQSVLRACAPLCVSEGDGVCDTPPDPGPEGCLYDAACLALCSGGARPDTSNLMSYYTACRRRFSPEQLRLISHTLALRRAWHPCLTQGCACTFGAGECPVGMACRPHAAELSSGGHCALSGPRAPSAACQTHAQCSGESLCLGEGKGESGQCVRVCAEAAPGCDCTPTNLGLRLCREDLTRSAASGSM